MSLNNSSNMFYGGNADDTRVTEWLNAATISVDSANKVELLRKVQEVVINKSPHLLSQVLDGVLGFTSDRDADVKKCLIGFIEQACKKQENILDIVMPNLHMLLCDESVQVQKRVIQAASSIYRNLLSWIAKATQITDSMEQAWNNFSSIKLEILNMVDSDNDGVRTHSVKFLEGVVLLQTYPDSDIPRKENDFSLNDIPLTLKFARRRKLEDEANHIFSLLVKFHGSPHISSVNLMACMGSLCTIAKARPLFMPRVVAALENLNSNLPPTLSHSQVSSVRKHLKLQLMNILKHPSSVELHLIITTVLQDLGCTPQEIARSIPKFDERKRNLKRNMEFSNQPVKRPKLENEDMEIDEEQVLKQQNEAKIINEQFINENLNVDTATQIVLQSLLELPNDPPVHFLNNYKPIGYVSLPIQIKQISKLLAEQMTDMGLGPGANAIDIEPPTKMKLKEDAIVKGTVKKESVESIEEPTEPKKTKTRDEEKLARSSKQKLKPLRLEQITRPLASEQREQMMVQAVRRILSSEYAANRGGAGIIRNKVITTLASTFGPIIRETVLMFILEDMKSHLDLALAWLYEEYSFMQGFNRMSSVLRRGEKPDQSYNTLLCTLIGNLESELRDRDILLTRIFLEAPLITEEAVEMLKGISTQENRSVTTMALMQELIYRRPPKYLTFLNVLLYQTAHEIAIVRDEALARTLDIYKKKDYQNIIEEHASVYLSFLTQPQPPPILFGKDRGRPQILDVWTDETSRACLYLYLGLLPYNEELIHELCNIYTQTSADVKRIILRFIEQPVRGMGIDSPELLTLVERCPKGSETLVTRIIHILTDRGPPSAHLVAKVRELYQTRVADVRFLIPVLNGLTKKEVLAALPKLIKLNPIVVKEVFNRLLNTSAESSVTPADLLIALHTIDSSKADLKTVMKATSLCFAEKSIYTQEVLAVVMQQLMDVTPLPTLLMRTVIQSLSLYPRLSGFVMNILQRLILKQVWKQKVVWEGFIKCCQRTKPQSFQVLLQLPPAQLAEALASCPELRKPLLEHVQAFTDSQRAHLSSSLMDVLLGRSIETEDGIVINKESETKEPILNPTEPLPPGMD